jgi:phage tail sheath protein FI
MVQVSYPGVYVVEVPSGVHTITGVATSVAAFFGRASRGPVNEAVHVLSLSDYQRSFGAPLPGSDLAQSVQQFFDNGGSECYVVRLAPNAKAADLTLKNLDTMNVLVVSAKYPGAFGNGLRVHIDYATPNPDELFNMVVSYEEAGVVISEEAFTNLTMDPAAPRFAPTFITQSSELVKVDLHTDLASVINTNNDTTVPGYSQSRLPLPTAWTGANGLQATFKALIDAGKSRFQISVNGSQWFDVDLSPIPSKPPVPANAEDLRKAIEETVKSSIDPAFIVDVKWDPLDGGSNRQVLRFTSQTDPKSSVRVQRGPTADIASSLLLGLDQGGIEEGRYANLRPVFNGSALFKPGAGLVGTTSNDLAALTQSAITSITIDGTVVDLTGLVTTVGTDRWYEDPAGSNDGVRHKLRIIADTITSDPTIPYSAATWGYHLALQRRAPGTINYTAAVTDGGAVSDAMTSNVRQYALGAAGTGDYQVKPGAVGDDGTAPTAADYLGSELDQTGFHALDSVDIFNLMVLPPDSGISLPEPDFYSEIVAPASTYCENHRAFLLVDAPSAWTANGRPVAQAVDVNTFRAPFSKNHSAAFYPRVIYSDRGEKRSIGPSGMIAGLMSRIDSTRGVWKAPAGVEADLRGVLDLEVSLTDKENGVLNKLGVNSIRKFPAGFVNWGGRTLDGSDDLTSEWKYISVRRTALFLEESLYRGTKWVVFEPNDEPLWAQIRMNLGAFMMSLFRQGAFQGSTPDKAFYVKCDSETTTPNDQNLGIVNIQVGFAPLKPAEFVVIRIRQVMPDLTA